MTENVHELKKEIERLKEIAYRDELTGALNRHGLKNLYEPFFNDAHFLRSRSGIHREHFRIEDMGIVFVDVDDFKQINDSRGHDAGDEILKTIATIFDENIRSVDAVCRFGGEEFVVLLLGANENESYKKAEELRAIVEKDTEVTGSFGVASLSSCIANSLENLIVCADKAMYEAKHSHGKNVVVRHSEMG